MPQHKTRSISQIIGRGDRAPSRNSAGARSSTTHPPPAAAAEQLPPTAKFSEKGSLMRLSGFKTFLENYIQDPTKNYRGIITILSDKLANHGFPYGELEKSGLRGPIRELSLADPETHGSDVVAMANELWRRWEDGDFERKPLSAQAVPREPPPPPPSAPVRRRILSSREQQALDAREEEVINSDTYKRLLRGIDIRHTNGQFRLTLTEPARPAGKYGHNGIEIGTIWPSQLAARRDGGHGSVMAGIYGSEANGGAYSIISSGGSGYEGSDNDQGDTLWYSGANLNAEEGSEEITGTSRLLVMSQRTQKPVRVIRGKGASSWAPVLGLRYDGLYRVVSHRKQRKTDGSGVFWQFEMRRDPEQEPLESVRDRSPSMEEKGALVIWNKTGRLRLKNAFEANEAGYGSEESDDTLRSY